MAPANLFNPPSPSDPGKPVVPKWVPPPTTKQDIDWATLHTIQLSLLDSEDPAEVTKLVDITKAAIKEDGFLFLTDYGVSLDQLHRQFDIAQYLLANISDKDKKDLLWDPSSGVFSGYKPRFGWQRKAGNVDGIEHFNFYEQEFESFDKVPSCIHPFMDEVSAFVHYLTHSVNRRLLKLLSLVLELPEDYLWDNIQAHDGTIGDGYFRHACYYPLDQERRDAVNGVRLYGHTDYGTTTMLFSVPVTALQIFTKEGVWKYVKYNPGALVINLGELLEVASGGHFKATLHKVTDPPVDQRDMERLSIVLFHSSKADLRVKPIADSPLIAREGYIIEEGRVFQQFHKLIESGAPIPTSKEWREAQIATRTKVDAQERLANIVERDGKRYTEDVVLGVPLRLPE